MEPRTRRFSTYSRLWLGSLLVLLTAGVSGSGQPAQPKGAAEWRAVIDRLRPLYEAREYDAIVALEPGLRASILGPDCPYYLPPAYMAYAFVKLGRPAESLPYFEKALPIQMKPDALRAYSESLERTHQAERGVRWLASQGKRPPGDAAVMDAAAARLTFFSLVEKGDASYLAGDRAAALGHYRQAQQQYDRVPVDPERQAQLLARFKPVWHEYTYYQGFDTPDGYKRRELLLESFLKPKLRLCEPASAAPNPVPFRLAVVVVRNTDVRFTEDGKSFRERNRLSDGELGLYRRSWRFASDALHCYSGGKLKVETKYFDLPAVTLTGLDDRLWKGLIHVRHLDPARLEPPQDDLFKKIVAEYDGISFIWPRGRAARAHGGGPVALPYRGGKLPLRAGIKGMPLSPAIALHELLHNFQARLRTEPVHGPRDWSKAPPAVQDELDWYLHLVSSVKDWSSVRFRTVSGPAEGPIVD